jgi:DNA polymerase
MQCVVALDTELYYDKNVSVKPLGTWKYVRHPQADCYMVSVSDGKETWAGHPRDFKFSSLDGALLISHNASFDEEVYLAQVEKGLWPKINYAAWHCTADMSAYLCNRRSLADASAFLLEHSVSKEMRNWMKGKSWDDAVREGKSEALLEYARDDASLCWRLWDEHSERWPEWERELSVLTRLQGRAGVYIHPERLRAGIDTLRRVVLACLDELPWVAEGRPPASPLAIAQACRDAGIEPPPVKAHDAEAAEEWEEQYGHQTPWLKALKDLRKAKKMLATLETMDRRLRPDGTMGFALKYFGAHTGRWAGEAGLNFQNFNRMPMFVQNHKLVDDPAQVSKLYTQFKKEPDNVPGVSVVDVRGLIVAPTGKQIAAVDLSQIEPRVLNYLVENGGLLKRIREGFPIYEAHARESMGWTGGPLKKENEKLYALAKARVLGLGYGCGADKFIIVAKMLAGLDITEDDEAVAIQQSIDGNIHYVDEKGRPCDPYVFVQTNRRLPEKVPVLGANSRKIVQEFRRDNPMIVKLWRKLQEDLESSVGKDLILELPSGRSLVYRSVTTEEKSVMDKEGNPYKKQIFKAEVDGMRTYFYGGLITENLVQAVARDVFSQNMLALHKAGIRVLWTVHDEAVCLVSSKEEGEQARKIMATAPEWLKNCPVDSELTLSDRYKK